MIAQVRGELIAKELDHVEIITEGGVGYEQELVTAGLLANRDLRVVPLLRRGDESAIPAFLRGRRAIDFRDDSPAAFEELVHAKNRWLINLLKQQKRPSRTISCRFTAT